MMEIFAGYGAHVDHEIGRVLDAVVNLPDADNTIIIYIVGDNGSSAEGGIEGSINENTFFNGISERWQDNIKVIDELGGPKHFNHFPSAWAWAMNTPSLDEAGGVPFRRHSQSDDRVLAGEDCR